MFREFTFFILCLVLSWIIAYNFNIHSIFTSAILLIKMFIVIIETLSGNCFELVIPIDSEQIILKDYDFFRHFLTEEQEKSIDKKREEIRVLDAKNEEEREHKANILLELRQAVIEIGRGEFIEDNQEIVDDATYSLTRIEEKTRDNNIKIFQLENEIEDIEESDNTEN